MFLFPRFLSFSIASFLSPLRSLVLVIARWCVHVVLNLLIYDFTAVLYRETVAELLFRLWMAVNLFSIVLSCGQAQFSRADRTRFSAARPHHCTANWFIFQQWLCVCVCLCDWCTGGGGIASSLWFLHYFWPTRHWKSTFAMRSLMALFMQCCCSGQLCWGCTTTWNTHTAASHHSMTIGQQLAHTWGKGERDAHWESDHYCQLLTFLLLMTTTSLWGALITECPCLSIQKTAKQKEKERTVLLF